MSRRYLLAAIFLAVAVLPLDARPRGVGHPTFALPEDVFSLARPNEVRTTHLELDLTVDFETRTIRGTARHYILNRGGWDEFVVDIRNLEILEVRVDGVPAEWTSTTTPLYQDSHGLEISIESDSKVVEIEYETAPRPEGARFLTAMQTLGDQEPFLYTLVQPDQTRSWIPLQDTPSVRVSWSATIRVPEGLLAVMSAPNPTEPSEDGIYRFEMDLSMPSYLIALAVGRLEFHPIGERSGIYVEPEIAEEAKWDLQYLPAMIEATERILGPYPLARYDILVAPPGFGAGGMENPLLNFINVMGIVDGNFETPLPPPASLTAHELAHTWAGDVTTCGVWNDTWLNEGFATYLEARILEEMVDSDRSELEFYWDRMNYESYLSVTAQTPDRQRLHRDFRRGDRPSIFSATTYSKGGLFLKTLEDLLGREIFDELVRDWFRRYAYHHVTSEMFLEHVKKYIPGDAPLLLEEWIFDSGLPDNVTAPMSSTLWDEIGREADRFRSGVAASDLETADWTSFEHSIFLWQITDLVVDRIAELDETFGYSDLWAPTPHWTGAVAEADYAPGRNSLERYLEIGTSSAIHVFARMVSSGAAGRARAIEIWERVKPHYVDWTSDYIESILYPQEGSEVRDAA